MKKINIFIISFFLISEIFAGSYTLIHLDSKNFIKAEVVSSPKQMAQGLMWRKELDEKKGMLFVYPKAISSPTFWMKNMIIPIDIIWLDESHHIVYYVDNVPPCQTTYCPQYRPTGDILSKYVLEIKAGERQKRGLKISQQLNFNI